MNSIAIAREIDLHVRKNESFRGKKVNFEKVQTYWDLKKACTALAQIAPCIKHLEEVPPGRDHRHAMIALDMEDAGAFPGNAPALFQTASRLADDVSCFACGHLQRLSFIIMNVWED